MQMLLWQNAPMGKSPEAARFRRSTGARSVSDIAAKLGGAALRRHGFVQDRLVSQWDQLVGPNFSSMSLPVKLGFPPNQKRGGTLTVRIEGPLATQFAHVQDVILERLNVFFGYRAVERIRLVQGDVPRREPRVAQRPASTMPPPLEVAQLADGPLKAALIQLAATFPVDKSD
jgi:hypothetical protein